MLILNRSKKFKYNKDFFRLFTGRINVGDKKHNISNITKVVSGSNKHVANYISKIYGKIIKAGIHLAPSIKVAEAKEKLLKILKEI